MARDHRYQTRLDKKYGYLRTIDIPAEVAEHAPWFNQTLTQVNDAVVRLGILQGSTTGTSTTTKTSASSCSRASSSWTSKETAR